MPIQGVSIEKGGKESNSGYNFSDRGVSLIII